MERYEARKAVVAQLEAEQFLVKVEPHKMMQPWATAPAWCWNPC